MPLIFSEADLACMRLREGRFNPTGLCNPGKIFPSRQGLRRSRPRLSPASDRREGPRPAFLASGAEGLCDDDGIASARQAPEHCRCPRTCSPGVDCSPYVLEGRTPEAVVFPGSKEESPRSWRWPAEREVPVLPWGGGTALGIGAPPDARRPRARAQAHSIGCIEHEPGDLTATVEAGITLEALQGELGQRGQWLSLDAASADRATLGGILASNASGPRRHLYGTARDLLIGVTVVGADGIVVRGGGKVVKNVAGLRPAQALHRLVRHAGRARRGDGQAAPAPRRGPARRRSLRAHLKEAGARGARGHGVRSHPVSARAASMPGRCARSALARAAPALLFGVDGIARAGRVAMRRAGPAPARRSGWCERPRAGRRRARRRSGGSAATLERARRGRHGRGHEVGRAAERSSPSVLEQGRADRAAATGCARRWPRTRGSGSRRPCCRAAAPTSMPSWRR